MVDGIVRHPVSKLRVQHPVCVCRCRRCCLVGGCIYMEWWWCWRPNLLCRLPCPPKLPYAKHTPNPLNTGKKRTGGLPGRAPPARCSWSPPPPWSRSPCNSHAPVHFILFYFILFKFTIEFKIVLWRWLLCQDVVVLGC